MIEPRIQPEKITKPIQLLAAWLAGLVVVNGAFLTGASYGGGPRKLDSGISSKEAIRKGTNHVNW